MTVADWVKLVGPYLLEILKLIFSGPHAETMKNLKERGLVKDSK